MSLAVVLFLIFLVLKLIGVIAWSWLWVTAPLWVGFVVAALFGGFALLVGGTAYGIGVRRMNRRR